MTTTNDATRADRVRMVVLLVLLAAGAPTQSAWARVESDINAFGQQLSIPKNTASGTVLARHYIAPMQACGASTCTVTSNYNFVYGDWAEPGPTIRTNVSGVSTRLLIDGQAYESRSAEVKPIVFTQRLEVQLLADGRPNTGGSLAGTHATSTHYYGLGGRDYSLRIYLRGTITPVDGTCSVPTQSVKLPDAWLHKFGGVGSTVGAHSFQIRVNNCPKGYNRIGYTLDPVGGVIAGSPGVLPLATDSTASGVKIRIADSKGVPAAFDNSIKLDAYDTATGGSYSIPMQASYIQTDSPIKPGTVNGAMTVLLDYQ